MVIDANMYWLPEELFKEGRLQKQFLAEISAEKDTKAVCTNCDGTNQKQIVIEKPIGFAGLNYVQGDYLLENQLKVMQKAGIDHAVLKLPGCQQWISLETCRYLNDKAAEHAAKSGGKMTALAVVPPHGTPECLSELERCYHELGMRGVQLSTHYGEDYLDSSKFEPLFKKTNELHMTIYVHHTPVPADYNSIYTYDNLRRSYGRCMDQMIALGRELFTGMLNKYPNIRMVHSMLGGGFFTYVSLLFPQKAKKSEAVQRFTDDNDKLLQQLERVYFEMSHAQPWGKQQLENAVRVLGSEHIIFGSSYPVRAEWLLDGAQFVESLDLERKEMDEILYGNAKTLYQIYAANRCEEYPVTNGNT